MSRDGARLAGRIGDVVFEPGNTLILDCALGFIDEWSSSRDFLLVRSLDGEQVPAQQRPWVALGAVAAMILGNSVGLWTVMQGALIATAIILAARCTTLTKARQSVDWSLLIVIAAAIGIGNALDGSGVLEPIADATIADAGDSPRWVVGAIFLSEGTSE